MTIIVDSNVIIAALIKNGIVRKIVVGNPGVWVMPEKCFEEIWDNRDRWNKNNISDDELKQILDDFVEDFVILVSEEVYSAKMKIAEKLVDDPDDVPIAALGLAVENEGIWTFNQRHFKRAQSKGISLLTTNDVVNKYQPIE